MTDDTFEKLYDALYCTMEGELGEKIDILERNRLRLAALLGGEGVDDCPPLATEVYLGDEIAREIGRKLFHCGYSLGRGKELELS